MKIKKLIDICKKTGNIFLYDTGKTRWISDGRAIYSISDLPSFDEFTLCKTYDISDKQASKINFRYATSLPSLLCFDDFCDTESISERGPMWLSHAGTGIIPFKTTRDVMFVESKYFMPLSDVDDAMISVYERVTQKGEVYFAVKIGLLLIAVITPVDVITDEFVSRLRDLTKQCEIELLKREEIKGQNSGQLEIKVSEDDKK